MILYRNKPLFFSSAIVLIAHALFIFWLAFCSNWTQIIPQPKQKLVTKTIRLQPKTEQPIASPLPEKIEEPVAVPLPEKIEEPVVEAAPAKIEEPIATPEAVPEKVEEPVAIAEPAPTPTPKPKPKVKPKPKEKAKPKEKPKPAAKPKAKPKPKPKAEAKPKPKEKPKANQAPDKREKLLAKAQESIAKIQQPHVKMTPNSSSATDKIGSLHIDSLSAEEIGYRDELANRLRRDLKLPEEGEVALKLTLTRAGKVVKVDIVKTRSDKNKKYLETALPKLSFPNFGKFFGGVSQYTFLLTLTNE